MSNYTIAILLYVLVGLNALVALATVGFIGKPRPPSITPKLALYTVISSSLVCALEVLAAGRLLHG